MSFSHQQWCV